jgi:glycosyltransferase involved in cell wall biosynthesis
MAVGDVFPWPTRDGYRLRFASVLQALAAVGRVDLFVGAAEGEEATTEPPDFIDRHAVAMAPRSRRSAWLVARTFGRPIPRRILWRDWAGAEEAGRAFASGPYDLVWYSHADSYVALGDSAFGPAIVDLDNLEDRIAQQPDGRTRVGLRSPAGTTGGVVRSAVKSVLDRRDAMLWSRLQHNIARRAAATIVCSDVDRRRLGGPKVQVIPNGYPDPGPPIPVPASSTIVMIARFTYEPNLAGAAWFTRSALPILQRSVPDVRVRLVGRHDERLPRVASGPGVEIVGEVERIRPEVAGARCVIVPLLSGSGTRIKVLEALAYGRPIVTTTIGCEGIGLLDNRHALIADDPASFAQACRRVLIDDDLSARLGTEGRRLYLEGFGGASIAAKIEDLANRVILSHRRDTP